MILPLITVEETDISELEKKYWILKAQSKSGKFDQDTFKSFVFPTIPESLCEGEYQTLGLIWGCSLQIVALFLKS